MGHVINGQHIEEELDAADATSAISSILGGEHPYEGLLDEVVRCRVTADPGR